MDNITLARRSTTTCHRRRSPSPRIINSISIRIYRFMDPIRLSTTLAIHRTRPTSCPNHHLTKIAPCSNHPTKWQALPMMAGRFSKYMTVMHHNLSLSRPHNRNLLAHTDLVQLYHLRRSCLRHD
jgi:hypothetical protein